MSFAPCCRRFAAVLSLSRTEKITSATPGREHAIVMISFGLRRVDRGERLVEGVTTLTVTS